MEKNKKMKKFTMIGIVLSLFVGIVYTGVLNYYGKVVGTVNVQGPIFYADFSQNKLLTNQKPSQSSFESLNSSESIKLESDDFNNIFNYKIKCIFSIKGNSSITNASLKLYCGYVDFSGEYKDLCSSEISLSSQESVYSTNCTAVSDSSYNIKKIVYKIEGTTENAKYTIVSDGNTYLQITKAS